MASAQKSLVDVVIVGAGPAGLMCATALAAAGITVRIIDKRAQQVMIGHADGVMPRSLEVLQSYGILDPLMRDGSRMHMAAIYTPRPQGGIEFSGMRTSAAPAEGPRGRWHFEVTLNQGMVETAYISAMKALQVHVERPVTPLLLHISTEAASLASPESYPVQVTVGHESHQEIIEAKYMIGADGASSWVRDAAGVKMDGDDTDHVWGVADFIPTTNFPDFRNRAIIFTKDGTHLLIPRESNKIRVYVQLQGDDPASTTTRENVMEAIIETFKPYTMHAQGPPEWWSIFGVRQKVASRYMAHERVLIVGDACHTHSPQAGQGMNAGINDSHNLAWKLAHVLRGWSRPSLLQTYEDERRKFAQELIAFNKVISDLRSKKDLTDDEKETHQRLANTFSGLYSGIGVRYQPSILIRNHHQHLMPTAVIGERMPLGNVIRAADGWPVHVHDLCKSDGRFKLFVFGGNLGNSANVERSHALVLGLTTLLSAPGILTDKMGLDNVFWVSHGLDGVPTYTAIRDLFGLHWTNIFVDAHDALVAANIGPLHSDLMVGTEGAVLVVRPDGYVGAVTSLGSKSASELEEYFSAFYV